MRLGVLVDLKYHEKIRVLKFRLLLGLLRGVVDLHLSTGCKLQGSRLP